MQNQNETAWLLYARYILPWTDQVSFKNSAFDPTGTTSPAYNYSSSVDVDRRQLAMETTRVGFGKMEALAGCTNR
jgi:hypothetical protein